MKQIIIALVLAFTTCALVNAQNRTTVVRDSIGKIKITVTNHNKNAKVDAKGDTKGDAKVDAKVDAKNTAVTVIGVDSADIDSVDLDSTNYSGYSSSINIDADADDFPFNNFEKAVGGGIVVAIVGIIAVFGMPIFILAIIFFFRYKNRKARYRLAEQALAAGQPLPADFLKENRPTDQRSQGIKNTFTGIGLFIFLWAITGELGIGSIGLLVMFMGVGQWIIGNKQEQQKELLKEQQAQTTFYTNRTELKAEKSTEDKKEESTHKSTEELGKESAEEKNEENK